MNAQLIYIFFFFLSVIINIESVFLFIRCMNAFSRDSNRAMNSVIYIVLSMFTDLKLERIVIW